MRTQPRLAVMAAVAAFLMAAPAGAQTGGGTAPEAFVGPTITNEQCRALQRDYWACPGEQGALAGAGALQVGSRVPGYVALRLVPDSIIATTPARRGHLYFATPEDRIAIVDPATRTIVAIE